MARSQPKAAATTEPEARQTGQPVEFSVRVFPVKDQPPILASANVDINGVFAVRNVKIIRGKDGPFVAMPQYKNGSGEYKDICFPCTRESRQQFNKTVLDAYEQMLMKQEHTGPTMEQSM